MNNKNQCQAFSHKVNIYSAPNAGFSLVEALISVVILGIAVSAGATIFNITTSETRRGRGLNEEQSAIAADVANLYSISERYACSLSATNSPSCSVSNTNTIPNQFTYVSSSLANAGKGALLTNFCNLTSTSNILTALETTLRDTANLAEGTGVTRDVSLTPNSNGLIRIRYLRATQIIYTTLINPPIVRWCP